MDIQNCHEQKKSNKKNKKKKRKKVYMIEIQKYVITKLDF